MRKIFLFSALAAILLQSCQKAADDKLPEQPPVSSDDPAKLSAAIKVWHGQRTTGNMPAPTGSLPELNPSANPEVKAFAGRYAIIKPEVLDGTVAGYYVGIAGAGQYFKVDYTKPRDIAGRIGSHRPVRGAKGSANGRLLDIQDGTADSSIVIVLPPSIQVPDTFCVTYYPYDPQGNIGAGVTTCIIVAALGADASSAWLQNKWSIVSDWAFVNGQLDYYDTIIYNKWQKNYNEGYGCYTGGPNGTYLNFISAAGGGPIPPVLVADSLYYKKYDLRFATSGAFDATYETDEKFVDLMTSNCSQFNFNPVETYTDITTGGWSYNAATGQLLFIAEFDYNGVPEVEVFEYYVLKITDTHCVLKDISYPGEEYFIRMLR
jgi:hypothetical protein